MSSRRRRVGATNPKILSVAKRLSKRLTKRGVRHALIGGLAVGSHGYERATKDADFLIADESRIDIAGESLGGEVEGKTIVVDGVDVGLLFPRYGEEFLDAAITRAAKKNGIPVIPIEALIYLKLTAARTRDQGDIVELVKRGRVNTSNVRTYLEKRRPDLVDDFDALVLQAGQEPD